MRPRSDEPGALTESAFDRELKEALDIDPSPEFLARVRTQLASEPEPAAWGFPLLFAAAGVAAIVVVAVVVTSRLEREETGMAQNSSVAASDPVGAQTPRSAVPDSSLPNTPSDSVVAQTFRSAPAKSVVARTAVADSVVAPTLRPAVGDSKPLEVIIAPDEVRGLRHLIAMANDEDASLESLLAGPTILATVGPEGELTLPPIKIEPLIPATDSDTQ